MANGSYLAGHTVLLESQVPVEEAFAERVPEFEAFFREHRSALSAYLRRNTKAEEDVQEIVQESFLRLLRYGYGSSRPAVVWKSLLYRIATNLAVSRLRSDRAHNVAGQQSLEDVELVSDSPSQERTILAQQELELIRGVIRGLSPKCRRVFLLSRMHRKTYPEIAELCGISVKMVEKYISQALAALRVAVGGYAGGAS